MWILSKSGLWQEPKNPVNTWDQLVSKYKYFNNRSEKIDKNEKRKYKFIFRGQGPYKKLKTSIERAFEEYKIKGNERQRIEKQLIRSFQRKAPYHLKGVCVPPPDETLEWLSLMQNYGAPTRLLDWTYSFYRAVYSAMQEWGKKRTKGHEVVIWVMNTKWFSNKTEGNPEMKVRGVLREKIKNLPESSPDERKQKKELLCALRQETKETTDYAGRLANNRNKLVQYLMGLERPLSLVYNMTPIGLNERVIYQQGTFLLPGNIKKSFMDNLKDYRDGSQNHLYRIPINLDLRERNKILEELNDMNINEAVLFPGLDGFARSLKMKLAFPHKL